AEDERAGGIMDLEAFLLEFELDAAGRAMRAQQDRAGLHVLFMPGPRSSCCLHPGHDIFIVDQIPEDRDWTVARQFESHVDCVFNAKAHSQVFGRAHFHLVSPLPVNRGTWKSSTTLLVSSECWEGIGHSSSVTRHSLFACQ